MDSKFEDFLIESLGPSALAHDKISVYDAAKMAWQARDAEIAEAEREAVRKCAELADHMAPHIHAAYPQHFSEVKPSAP